MRLFLFAIFFLSLSTPLFAFESTQPPALSENWISRPSPETPATDEEQVAVLAVSGRKDVTRENISAKYEGSNAKYATVTVTTIPEPESEIQIITRYRILNNLIHASTRPRYAASETQRNKLDAAKQLAYQLAVNANGVSSERPVISGDRMLAVSFDGKCDATVTEKDFDHVVVATYHFKLCN